jgi:aspartyl/asparaginyl beta-hydroxylase (cupin superfamily)
MDLDLRPEGGQTHKSKSVLFLVPYFVRLSSLSSLSIFKVETVAAIELLLSSCILEESQEDAYLIRIDRTLSCTITLIDKSTHFAKESPSFEHARTMICNACGKPPFANQKLSKCRNCQCAVYHGAVCQRNDWKRHKRVCPKIAAIFVPLNNEILGLGDTRGKLLWWDNISGSERAHHESLWREGYRIWNERRDYMLAVKKFQQSLESCQKAWQSYSQEGKRTDHQSKKSEGLQQQVDKFAFTLAKRLLFCAYCELDGQAIDAGRQRLVQCIYILFATRSAFVNQHELMQDWNDAWMELMLSMEEVAEQREFAKNIAALALLSVVKEKNSLSISSPDSSTPFAPCGWTDPWQRPGYMATQLFQKSPLYVPRNTHPSWCRQLEDHFPEILEDYQRLRQSARGWSKVGSGDRGSGQDDHRVVAGQGWSEYVLFGTGEQEGVEAASRTRTLIRQIVPDAVSLAQQGGGEVIFSRLAPHTHIQAHCGPTNLRWTAHLGLVVPQRSSSSRKSGEDRLDTQCQIRVGTYWHHWDPGKILLFDDSFEHEVRNDTDEERIVLLLRLWHPQLPVHLRQTCLAEARQNKESAVEKRYHPPPPSSID